MPHKGGDLPRIYEQAAEEDLNRNEMSSTNEDVKSAVEMARRSFESKVTYSLDWRKEQLRRLYYMFEDHEEEWIEALHKDLRKPRAESVLGELDICKSEIITMVNNLDAWSKDEYVKVPIAHALSNVRIVRQPLGVVLVIAPWNYPVNLAALPLIGALAAGNCVILKPSELASNVERLFVELMDKYMDAGCVHVLTGGAETMSMILSYQFDHIFYTGNGQVAKIIAQQAAKYLTPLTLELGGKSPCIIDESVDMGVTARRLVWGKWFNAGQTCVAPDYILMTPKRRDELVRLIQLELNRQFADGVQESTDYSRIINERHYTRLSKMLAATHGSRVIGNDGDASDRFFSPTVFVDVTADDATMQEEIFGPILPILTVSSMQEAITFVNARDKPLALYIFSNDAHTRDLVLNSTHSGGIIANDTLMQASISQLPFGGVGAAGYGRYHGKSSFDTFSNARGALYTPFWLDIALSSRYRPYTMLKTRVLQWLLLSKPPFTRAVGSASKSRTIKTRYVMLACILSIFAYTYRT